MLTEVKLRELIRKAESATPGPWAVNPKIGLMCKTVRKIPTQSQFVADPMTWLTIRKQMPTISPPLTLPSSPSWPRRAWRCGRC